MNYKNIKFDIVVIAGQSNAEGNGFSLNKEPIINNAYEIIDKNPHGMKLKPDGSYERLDCVYPVEVVVRELQERKSGDAYCYDFSLSFADEYIKNNLLTSDRKLLVIKAGYGGSGFALKQQGVGNLLHQRLLDMVDYGLSLNKENRIVAFLWHQGEHDAFENANFSDKERYDFYHSNLLNVFKDLKEKYSRFSFPFITGGFCDHWKQSGYQHQCEVVERATKDVCKEIGNATFVSAVVLHSNDEDIHNGDIIHFSKDALKTLGKKYFEAFISFTH